MGDRASGAARRHVRPPLPLAARLSDSPIDELIHRADLDGLVRLVDSLCAARDWPHLLTLRDRARAAVETGRQVWPIATLAEYRLALWAPPQWAARVLDEGSGHFSIGPLTEVVAVHHTYGSLAPYVPAGPRAGFIAHERALRGDEVDATGLLDVLELPYQLQPWEPQYCLASYTDDGVDAPSPALPAAESFRPIDVRARLAPVDDDAVISAIRQLVEPWTSSSDGHASVVCVEGDADDAVTALGLSTVTMAPLQPARALAWLAWAGASGGAHGRRRGGALGRFGAWWTAAALCDVTDQWPVRADELGQMIGDLRWWWWNDGRPRTGWQLQLAVADQAEGYAWAIDAHDAT